MGFRNMRAGFVLIIWVVLVCHSSIANAQRLHDKKRDEQAQKVQQQGKQEE